MTLAYGIEEPDLVHDDRRGDEQERENHHLCRTPERPHEKGPDAEEGRPQVDEQDRLALRVATKEQAVVDVPGVGRGDGLVLAQTAHDGGSRVDDGDECHDDGDDEQRDREQARGAHERDGSQQQPEQHRTRIAHEDACRVEIVNEKRTGDGSGDGGEQCRLRLVQGHEHDEERDGRHAGNARGKAIKAVDEVDDVDEADEVYDRDGIGPKAEIDDGRGAWNLERVQDGARRGDDAGGQQLS